MLCPFIAVTSSIFLQYCTVLYVVPGWSKVLLYSSLSDSTGGLCTFVPPESIRPSELALATSGQTRASGPASALYPV